MRLYLLLTSDEIWLKTDTDRPSRSIFHLKAKISPSHWNNRIRDQPAAFVAQAPATGQSHTLSPHAQSQSFKYTNTIESRAEVVNKRIERRILILTLVCKEACRFLNGHSRVVSTDFIYLISFRVCSSYRYQTSIDICWIRVNILWKIVRLDVTDCLLLFSERENCFSLSTQGPSKNWNLPNIARIRKCSSYLICLLFVYVVLTEWRSS